MFCTALGGISPKFKAAQVGEGVSFLCHGCRGIASWTFNDSMLPSNVHISNNHIYIKDVKNHNEGIYECECHSTDMFGPPFKNFISKVTLVLRGQFVDILFDVFLMHC